MTVAEIVGLYYDAWQARHGDFSAVPLADDFAFTGPVASFTDAAGYRAMAREAGPLVTRFSVRHQFTDGFQPRSWASAASRFRMRRWPKWTPSKLPMVRALGPKSAGTSSRL